MNKKIGFFVILFIFSVISSMLILDYLVTLILGLSFDLLFPLPVRLLGLFIIAVGLSFASWTLFYRKPLEIMESSYATIRKAIKKISVNEKTGRRETLIILGPYKYVRHPQYFGVILLMSGLGFLLSFTFLFFGSLFLFIWFRFVLIPFEEKELLELFGDQYEKYMRQVPSIFPFTNLF
jgi:protein-S-isoprenylcysteine O-methyltransferase Ste14